MNEGLYFFTICLQYFFTIFLLNMFYDNLQMSPDNVIEKSCFNVSILVDNIVDKSYFFTT